MRDAVLILAQSGRALAKAARRAGLRPYVADLFGDEDTRELAVAWRLLRGALGGGVRRRSALAAASELADLAGDSLVGLVLGSGFEAAPALVAELARHYRLLGAEAAVIDRLKDPVRLELLLAELGIPHPPISLTARPPWAGWLRKRVGGSGGGHIRPARGSAPRPGEYGQKQVEGRPVSVAFLTDGRDCEILGFSEQWTAPSRGAPFRYGGAVAPAALASDIAGRMADAAGAIARTTGLRGLASADCLVDQDRWWLLEINPRPGATLDVIDRRRTPILLRHIQACSGGLGSPESAPGDAAASEILYARRTIPVVPVMAWPDHVADRPSAGSRIAAGAPICTVMAEAATASLAREMLQARCGDMRSALEREGHGHEWVRIAAERECSRRTTR